MIILFYYLFIASKYRNVIKIESTIDKKYYMVSNRYKNKQEASNTMYKVNEFIKKFMSFMYNKYIINHIMYKKEEVEFVQQMIKNYKPDNLFEHDPMFNDLTSYVTNKGDEFGVCIRNKNRDINDIHDFNTIKFVILHEITHLGCTSYGHEMDFWSWFQFNLIQAEIANLYIPVDFKNNPVNYCGMDIKFSPYYDRFTN